MQRSELSQLLEIFSRTFFLYVKVEVLKVFDTHKDNLFFIVITITYNFLTFLAIFTLH